MVRTRIRLENFSKEELIEELICVEGTSSKLPNLTSRFDNFLRRCERCELAVTINCQHLLNKRIVHLQGNVVNDA